MRLSPSVLLCLLAAGVANPAGAQQVAVPVDVGVTVAQSSGSRSPLMGLTVWFVRKGGTDSSRVQTNREGRAQLSLPLGEYRVRTAPRVPIGDKDWWWDVSFTVTRNARIDLRLTEANAFAEAAAMGPVIVVQPERAAAPELPPYAPPSVAAAVEPAGVVEPGAGAPRRLQSGDPGYKSPGLGVLLGLLIAGGGHFYAEETGTGAGLLVGAILGGVVVASTYDEYEGCIEACAAAAIGTLGLYIYSVVDAASAATRYNTKYANRRFALNLRPLPADRVGIGVRVGF